MELLKLSKFKLQLQALISEVKQLKEKERFASDQVELMIQKEKRREEEFGQKMTDLREELGLSNEIRQKLEKKVNFLESENVMLENKQKELKETISGLLQSKESFLQVYEDSFGEMKRAVEDRDRKISILSEKIKAHILLFDTIEKEANSLKQVVDKADRAIKEREEVEKINYLESQLINCKEELKRKDKNILVLEAQLEAASFSENFQPRVDELQKALSAKELVIQNLVLEKQALQFEVFNLGFVIQKVQDAVSRMDQEDRKAFSLPLDEARKCVASGGKEVNRYLEDVGRIDDFSHHNTCDEEALGNSECQKSSTVIPSREDCNLDSSVSEAAELPAQSTCSQPQFATDTISLSNTEAKDVSIKSLNQVESACSRSQADNP